MQRTKVPREDNERVSPTQIFQKSITTCHCSFSSKPHSRRQICLAINTESAKAGSPDHLLNLQFWLTSFVLFCLTNCSSLFLTALHTCLIPSYTLFSPCYLVYFPFFLYFVASEVNH